MAASYDFVQLDVFTRTPLAGNPLAVFTDARGLTDKQMQALAREMNLSETTFILPRELPTNYCQIS
jgi:trans-2,3-dihydro-3-hydroxyanthranilate isomerase